MQSNHGSPVNDCNAAKGPLPNGVEQSSETEFDLNKYAYRAPGGGSVRREQLTIPEGRPKDCFFRVDPRPEMQLKVSIFEYQADGRLGRDTYILTPDVAEHLGHRARPAVIRVCIRRPSILQLWAVKEPKAERGTPNGYTISAWEALPTLEKHWASLVQNESSTGYDVVLAENQWADPEWRDESLAKLVLKAFRGRFVDDLDHELIQKLQGRI